MSPGTQTIEDKRTSPVDVPLEPGDHERFSHYVEKAKLTEAMVMGTPVVALCGNLVFAGGMERIEVAEDHELLWLDAAAAKLLCEVGVQALHSLFPTLFVGRRKRKPSEEELLACRLFSREFYELVRDRLTPGGTMTMQAGMTKVGELAFLPDLRPRTMPAVSIMPE